MSWMEPSLRRQTASQAVALQRSWALSHPLRRAPPGGLEAWITQRR